MKPVTLIRTAMAAGAAANFRPNIFAAGHVITDDYLALKSLIKQKYPGVDVDLLDIGPGSAERQEVITEQLREAGIAEDEEVLRQAQAVLDAIAEHDPKALKAAEVTEKSPDHS